MRKAKIKSILGFTMVMTMGISLIGCNGTKRLEQSIVINDNVKSTVFSSILKIVEKNEYEVSMDTDFINEDIFVGADGNLYINSLLDDARTSKTSYIEDSIANKTFIIERFILDGQNAIKEEVESGKIFKENRLLSHHGIYNVELISEKEVRFFNPLTNDEFSLDYDKLKSLGFYSDYNEHGYELWEDKLVRLNIDSNGNYKNIEWIDINDYSTGSMEFPLDVNSNSLDTEVINNKTYYLSNYYKYNNIGIIDFEKGIIEEPTEIVLNNEEIVWHTINLDNDLVLMIITEYNAKISTDAKLKVFDLNNKTTKDVGTIKNFSNKILISPDKKKIVYEQTKSGESQIVVSSLNNGELQNSVTIHQYDNTNEYIHISWGKNSSDIILTKQDIYSGNEKSLSNVKSIIEVKLDN